MTRSLTVCSLVTLILCLFTVPVVASEDPNVAIRISQLEKDVAQIKQRQDQQEEVGNKILVALAGLKGEVSALNKSLSEKPSPKAEAKVIPPPIPKAKADETPKVTTLATHDPKCTCGDVNCKAAAVAPVPQAVTRTVAKTVYRLQPASGHTHTCANGHTWDHTMDGGTHRCPTCGLSSFYQSHHAYVYKPTLVYEQVADATPTQTYINPEPTPVQAYVPAPQFSPAVTYTLGGYSVGGCASGSCGSASYSSGRTGWYPGKLLGR